MPDLFGVDIGGLIHSSMSSGLPSLTLERSVAGARSATDPTAGVASSTTTHAGRGIIEDYTDREIDGSQVQRGDRKVLIIARSLSPAVVPIPGDRITIEGMGPMRVVEGGVKRDPAAATYLCQVRAF